MVHSNPLSAVRVQEFAPRMESKTLRQQHVVLVCAGSDCKKNGGKKIYKSLKELIRAAGLGTEVRVQACKCMGHCKKAPNVMAYPEGKVYSGVKPKDAEEVLASTCGLERV